ALAAVAAARPERALDLWIGTSLASDRTTQVLLAWTLRSQGRPAEAGGTISVVVQGTGDKQTFDAPLDAQRLSFKADPGALQIKTTVRDARGQTIDEESRQVTVPELARAQLALSSPAVLRARNPAELRALR